MLEIKIDLKTKPLATQREKPNKDPTAFKGRLV